MDETVLLDACCTLNFSATNRAADLLRDLPYRFVVGARARGEDQWLAIPGAEEREPVDLQMLFEQGLLGGAPRGGVGPRALPGAVSFRT
jgi:hypothetical protein